MRALIFGISFFLSGALFGAPFPESQAVQEMRLNLERVSQQLHSHEVDLTLFQERVQKLEDSITSFKQELKTSPVEKRLSSLEKAQETLAIDLKTLKAHLNETNTALAQCQTHLGKIDKQLSSDIQSLKNSLQSMLALLQGSPADQKNYTVQHGDSLGQIALDHKTDVKTLKKLNNLASDTIFAGQKLLIP